MMDRDERGRGISITTLGLLCVCFCVIGLAIWMVAIQIQFKDLESGTVTTTSLGTGTTTRTTTTTTAMPITLGAPIDEGVPELVDYNDAPPVVDPMAAYGVPSLRAALINNKQNNQRADEANFRVAQTEDDSSTSSEADGDSSDSIDAWVRDIAVVPVDANVDLPQWQQNVPVVDESTSSDSSDDAADDTSSSSDPGDGETSSVLTTGVSSTTTTATEEPGVAALEVVKRAVRPQIQMARGNIETGKHGGKPAPWHAPQPKKAEPPKKVDVHAQPAQRAVGTKVLTMAERLRLQKAQKARTA